jgi:hypothetical protein
MIYGVLFDSWKPYELRASMTWCKAMASTALKQDPTWCMTMIKTSAGIVLFDSQKPYKPRTGADLIKWWS